MKVLTGGTFDLIHYGHILHLEACEKLANWRSQVYVMLVTDEWGRERKREPILSYEERKAILVGIGIADSNIFPVGKPSDLALRVISLKPDYYVYEYGTNQEAHELALAECKKLDIRTEDIGKNPINPFGTTTTSMVERILNDRP